MSDYRTAKKRKPRPLLPVMGLLLAVALGVFSYFIAPTLVDFGVEQNDTIRKEVETFENDPPSGLPEKTFDYITAGFMWLILMGLFMFVASVAIGQDPEKESWKNMGPSPANKKAVAKQLKKDIKVAKRRQRERQRHEPKR
jgi:hypothetical protein